MLPKKGYSCGMVRTMACLLFPLAMLAVSGCGNRPLYSCVPVSGKVTFENGALIPADEINLIFLPLAPGIDPKVPPRPGRADVDTQTGSFEFATTYVQRDGIISGDHKVVVQCLRKRKLARGLIADEYSSAEKTPLKVNSSESPFDLKLRKQL